MAASCWSGKANRSPAGWIARDHGRGGVSRRPALPAPRRCRTRGAAVCAAGRRTGRRPIWHPRFRPGGIWRRPPPRISISAIRRPTIRWLASATAPTSVSPSIGRVADGRVRHPGSRRNLLGTHRRRSLRSLSNETQMTAQTPPTFLVHGRDDSVVPYQHSVVFQEACRRAGSGGVDASTTARMVST